MTPPPPTGRTLSINVTDNVAILTLTRPESGNALNLELATQFRDAVYWLEGATEIGALLVTGSGRLFCAGGDVREMALANDRPTFVADLTSVMHDALRKLRQIPLPIIAAIQGPAAGAGIGLILAADIAVASAAANFRAAYSTIGLTPDCGVSALLPAALGSRRAAVFALTDIVLTAEQALEWGLVSQICAADELPTIALSIATQLAARPSRSAGETARLMRAQDAAYAQQLNIEARTISIQSGTADAANRIGQFALPTPHTPEEGK